MTEILWAVWMTEDQTYELMVLRALVKKARENPGASIVGAYDSEGDFFYVLVSGDTSDAAVTAALEKILEVTKIAK